VAVHDALVRRRLLTHRDGLRLAPRGRAWFDDLGVDVGALEGQRRVLLSETPPAMAYVGGVLALVGVSLARRKPRAGAPEGAPALRQAQDTA